jgi:hypothetical protein
LYSEGIGGDSSDADGNCVGGLHSKAGVPLPTIFPEAVSSGGNAKLYLFGWLQKIAGNWPESAFRVSIL